MARVQRTRLSAREKLMSAGGRLFAERGFSGASTHALARAAGVPQGLVRYHCGSKEGLWRELVEAGLQRITAALGQRSEPAAASIEALASVLSNEPEWI